MEEQTQSNLSQLAKEVEKLNYKLNLVRDGVFQDLIKYLEERAKLADEVWHRAADISDEHFIELKTRKYAYNSVLEYIAFLEDDKQELQDEIESLDE